jgi:hypothetical protein
MRSQEAGRGPGGRPSSMDGGQGVRREGASDGLASTLRAVAEARARANRSARIALIRAGSLTGKGLPAERGPRQGVGGPHGGTEARLTWGGLAASPTVFRPRGPKSRREQARETARPTCRAEAPRVVRAPSVVRTRCESGAERRGATKRERGEAGRLRTALEARAGPVGKTPVPEREGQVRGPTWCSPRAQRKKHRSIGTSFRPLGVRPRAGTRSGARVRASGPRRSFEGRSRRGVHADGGSSYQLRDAPSG